MTVLLPSVSAAPSMPLQDEVAERAVSAAEFGTFEGDLAWSTREQAEEVALNFAELLDVGVDAGALDGADGARLAGHRQRAEPCRLSVTALQRRLQFGHG